MAKKFIITLQATLLTLVIGSLSLLAFADNEVTEGVTPQTNSTSTTIDSGSTIERGKHDAYSQPCPPKC